MATKDMTQGLSEREIVERTLEAVVALSQIWNVGRQGLIVTLTGARVGTWKWDTNRMLLSAERGAAGKDFAKLLSRLQKEGVFVSGLAPAAEPKDGAIESVSVVYQQIELSRASPGELDAALKGLGYYLLDLDLAFAAPAAQEEP